MGGGEGDGAAAGRGGASWEALFDELADLGTPERQRRLAEIGEEDPRLAAFLAQLLAADGDATALGPGPLPERASTFVAAALAGDRDRRSTDLVGPYRLLGTLGAGGMGEVFLAERADGEFEQRVAIKLIRGDSISPGFLERFRRERQILAGLDHPGIARLLDGGRTAEGDPYIVLELVEGERITDWCRRTGAGLEERLRLVREVAAAVDAAHRRLVVHRDLKPSNILVTAEGRPKLLDFGIAKILEDDGGASAETLQHGGPLTPAYAAPEQILGEPVTTATDVYALGVLLYELLAGRSPFARRGRSLGALVRSLDGETVTRPSVAARGGEGGDAAVRAFAPRLAGDLDTIVAKALQRHPARRYPSVAALADDITGFLEERPVSARPDSLGYRLGKLVRRHRVTVTVGAAATAVLAASLVASGLRLAAERDLARQAARRAEAGRAEAEAARREAVRVTEFLVGLFGEANPLTAGSREPTAREILDRGGRRLARELADEPAARARIEEAIARAYLGLMRPVEAQRHVAAAREARQAAGIATLDGVVRLLVIEGSVHLLGEEFAAAEAVAREAMALAEGAPGTDRRLLSRTLSLLATSQSAQGRFAESEAETRRAIDLLAPYGPDDPELLDERLDLARNLYRLGRYDDARAELAGVLDQVEGRDDRLRLWGAAVHLLGVLARLQGDWDLAERRFGEALALAERLDGPASPRLVDALMGLGFVASRRGQAAAALDHYARARAVAEQAGVSADRAIEGTASVLRLEGRLEEAAAALEEVLARRTAAQGPVTSDVAWTLYELASVELARGRRRVARTRYEAALAAFEGSVGPAHHWTSWPLHELGEMALADGDRGRAEALLARAVELREAGLPAGREETAASREALVRARGASAARTAAGG